LKISLSRTEYVAKKLDKLNGDKILDIGCREMIPKNICRIILIIKDWTI
tara:strand:+ start:3257 stop:3403 length:147 start_codon:yes stop_codon:yes gene_type:complete